MDSDLLREDQALLMCRSKLDPCRASLKCSQYFAQQTARLILCQSQGWSKSAWGPKQTLIYTNNILVNYMIS